MVERPDGGADHETLACEAPDVRARQDQAAASSPDRPHVPMISENAPDPVCTPIDTPGNRDTRRLCKIPSSSVRSPKFYQLELTVEKYVIYVLDAS